MRASISRSAERGTDAVRDSLPADNRPLVVDVDELLIRSDGAAGRSQSKAAHGSQAIVETFAGPEGLQSRNPNSSHFDPAQALFDPDVMTFLLRAIGEGRPVYLCSQVHPEPVVRSLAQHLGVFPAWSAESGKHQPAEAADLPAALRQGFHYLGGRTAALPEAVSTAKRVARHDHAAAAKVGVWAWLKLLRPHQYAKNALVVVPLVTAHKFASAPAVTAFAAVIAFSLCASSAYILNDILDVKADRAHPSKRSRPIASGAISVAQASWAMVLTLICAMLLAISISIAFAGALAGYFVLTTAYSLWLKRIAIIDVVVLATLYTIRVVGGAVAIGVTISEWLLAFSLFMFMSLALVKRYIELDGQPSGRVLAARDYQTDDKPMIAVLAAASGFNAVVIFTLYISSEAVRSIYGHPHLLWIGCPILMYWIGRVMLLARRGLINDDPVVFAIKDRVSWLALGAIGATMFVAM